MKGHDFITRHIPHRPPFLWLDRVVELGSDFLVAEKDIAPDLAIFQGHYPGRPVMPGVLLCEAVFQAGGLLIGCRAGSGENPGDGVPLLARIQGAGFKREVGPGDTIRIRVDLLEQLGGAWFFKGTVRVLDRVAVRVQFSCVLKS